MHACMTDMSVIIPTHFFFYAALPVEADDLDELNIERVHFRVWKTIGRELGVNEDKLYTIEIDFTDDETRFSTVIMKAGQTPTRGALTKILQSSLITNAIAGILQ